MEKPIIPTLQTEGTKPAERLPTASSLVLAAPQTTRSFLGRQRADFFETITKGFLEEAFALLRHLRPGEWYYSTKSPISGFDQYEHLANLEKIVEQDNLLASVLGTDYIITPDIVIGRWPVSDEEVNRDRCVYHFALPELQESIAEIENEDQMDMLKMLIEGRRLRDISDLPFDLAT